MKKLIIILVLLINISSEDILAGKILIGKKINSIEDLQLLIIENELTSINNKLQELERNKNIELESTKALKSTGTRGGSIDELDTVNNETPKSTLDSVLYLSNIINDLNNKLNIQMANYRSLTEKINDISIKLSMKLEQKYLDSIISLKISELTIRNNEIIDSLSMYISKTFTEKLKTIAQVSEDLEGKISLLVKEMNNKKRSSTLQTIISWTNVLGTLTGIVLTLTKNTSDIGFIVLAISGIPSIINKIFGGDTKQIEEEMKILYFQKDFLKLNNQLKGISDNLTNLKGVSNIETEIRQNENIVIKNLDQEIFTKFNQLNKLFENIKLTILELNKNVENYKKEFFND